MNRWIKADQSCYAQQNPWYGNSTCWYLTLSVKDFNEKYYNKEIYCNRILMNFLEGSINFAGLYAHLNSGGLTPSTLGDWCDYCSVFWWWLSIWSWAWATRRISQHPSWLFCTPRYRLCKPWQDDVHTSASTFVIKKWMNVGYIYIYTYIYIYSFMYLIIFMDVWMLTPPAVAGKYLVSASHFDAMSSNASSDRNWGYIWVAIIDWYIYIYIRMIYIIIYNYTYTKYQANASWKGRD